MPSAVSFAWLTALILTSAALPAQAASFVCAQSGLKPNERLICSDPALSSLDDRLDAAYGAYVKSLSEADRRQVTFEERAWAAQRDRSCHDVPCLTAAYRQRLAQLPAAEGISTIPAPAPPTAGTLPPSPGAAASLDYARRVHLTTMQGLPVLDAGTGLGTLGTTLLPMRNFLSLRGDADRSREARLTDAVQWNKLIRELGLRVTPPTADEQQPVLAQLLACELLTKDAVTTYFDASGVYGPLNDMCVYDLRNTSPGAEPLLRSGTNLFFQREVPKLIAEAPTLPFSFLVRWSSTTSNDGYARGQNGYPISGNGRTNEIFGTPLDTPPPRFWPIDPNEASRFEGRLGKSVSIPVYFAMRVTITGTTPRLAPGDTRASTGLGGNQNWRFDEGEVVLYEDEALTHPLHRFESVPAAPTTTGPRPAGGSSVAAARAWNVEAARNLPALRIVSGPGGEGSTFITMTDDYSNARPQMLAWTRMGRAMGLRASPEIDPARITDRDAIRLSCLYGAPAQIAALGARPYCSGNPPQTSQQFVYLDMAAKARTEILTPSLAKAPGLPFQFMYVTTHLVGDWNRNDQGFPLTGGPQFGRPMAFGTVMGFTLPKFWPAPEAQARAFLAGTPPPSGQFRVYMATPVTIVSALVDPNNGNQALNEVTGLASNREWQFEAGAPTLYADEALIRPLYSSYSAPAPFPKPSYGTEVAADPHPVGPVVLSQETILLEQLARDPSLVVDWTMAARARLQIDNEQVISDYPKPPDPWGRFFFRRPQTANVPLSKAEIDGFAEWTRKRAKALPPIIQSTMSAFPAPGPLRLTVFSKLDVTAFRQQGVFFDNSGNGMRYYEDWFKARGIAPERTRSIELDMSNSGLRVLAFGVLPAPRDSYVLDVPTSIPPKPVWEGGNVGDMSGALDVQYAIERTEIVPPLPGRGSQVALALYLQPIGARLRTVPGDKNLASVKFEHVEFPAETVAQVPAPAPTVGADPAAPAPPVATLAPPGYANNPSAGAPGGDPRMTRTNVSAEQRWKGPVAGPDVIGVKIGMSLAEAETLIREHMNVVRVMTTAPPNGAEPGPAIFRGKLFIADDQKEWLNAEQIAIYEAPAPAAGRVVGVYRSVRINRDNWAPLNDQLAVKYGKPIPAFSGAHTPFFLSSPELQCKQVNALTKLMWGGKWLENGTVPADASRGLVIQMPSPEVRPLPDYSQCRTVVETDSQNSPKFNRETETYDLFVTRMYDPGILVWLMGQPVPVPPAAAGDPPRSGVKL